MQFANEETSIKIKSRKRQAYPENWKINQSKLLTNNGKSYKTQQKETSVPEREMRPP